MTTYVPAHQGLVIQSSDPAVVITALLQHLDTLNDHGHEKADRIRDTNVRVLDALKTDEKPEGLDLAFWVNAILERITEEMNALIPQDELLQGRYFGRRGVNEWGWWYDRRTHPRS